MQTDEKPTTTRATPGAPTDRPTGRPNKEVTHPMQLTALLDYGSTATLTTGEIPCQSNDPELWFADTPDGVEFAKALCVSCPMIEGCLERGARAARSRRCLGWAVLRRWHRCRPQAAPWPAAEGLIRRLTFTSRCPVRSIRAGQPH